MKIPRKLLIEAARQVGHNRKLYNSGYECCPESQKKVELPTEGRGWFVTCEHGEIGPLADNEIIIRALILQTLEFEV